MKSASKLLKEKADPNLSDQFKHPPLHYASNIKDLEKSLQLIQLLFENGANPFAVDRFDKSTRDRLLDNTGWKEEKMKFIKRFDQLVEKLPSRVKIKTTRSLEDAIRKDKANVLNRNCIIRTYHPVHGEVSIYETTPLFFAIFYKSSELIKKLIDLGANRGEYDPVHGLPIHLFLDNADNYSMRKEMFELLLTEKGIYSNDPYGNTTMHKLMRYTNSYYFWSCLELLLKKGANPFEINNTGLTPRYYLELNAHERKRDEYLKKFDQMTEAATNPFEKKTKDELNQYMNNLLKLLKNKIDSLLIHTSCFSFRPIHGEDIYEACSRAHGRRVERESYVIAIKSILNSLFLCYSCCKKFENISFESLFTKFYEDQVNYFKKHFQYYFKERLTEQE